jgi:ribosomal protein S18 acetylase RimI-like enzyme
MKFMSAMNHMEHLHKRDVPPEHWYLFVLGVEPDRQGQGVGGKMIAPILEARYEVVRRFTVRTAPQEAVTAGEYAITILRRKGK